MVTIQGWMDMPFREMPPETFLMLLDIYTTDAIFPNCPSSPTLTETRRNRYSFPFCIGKTEASSSQGLTCMRLHQDYNSGTLVFLSGAFFTPPRLWFKHLTNVLWECPYEIYALSNSVYFWLCGKILETLVTFFFLSQVPVKKRLSLQCFFSGPWKKSKNVMCFPSGTLSRISAASYSLEAIVQNSVEHP